MTSGLANISAVNITTRPYHFIVSSEFMFRQLSPAIPLLLRRLTLDVPKDHPEIVETRPFEIASVGSKNILVGVPLSIE